MEVAQLQQTVLDHASRQSGLAIAGGNSKSFYGREISGTPLNMSDYNGFINYDPSELVITVKSGTRVRAVIDRLAESGQMLPFEPPVFSEHSTIGGVVAAGLSGPARAWTGSVRDYVLGITCINGRGQVLRFGGQVMKNVAGYDASRLITGSLGTLAVILEISFKVLPIPETEETVYLDMDQKRAIDYMANLNVRPLPVSGTCFYKDRLYIRLSGSRAGVDAALDQLDGDLLDDKSFWQSLRDQQLGFFESGEDVLWRLSLPQATAPLPLDGEPLLEWGGALRWLKSAQSAEQIRDLVVRHGGTATQFRNADRSGQIFHPLSPVVHRLNQNIKRSFDPDKIFNPQRMYQDI